MKTLKIGARKISEGLNTFIIAEVGVNYYDIAAKENISVIDAAKLMIDKAAVSGADAVKFQTYKAEKIASKFSPAYWDVTKEPTKSQYELFKKFDKLTESDYTELAKYTRRKGIVFISTPFDEEAVDLLDKLAPVFKIASADLNNTPFLRYIAAKGKPIILSTGASNLPEIHQAVKVIESEGNKDLALLHCILNYPTCYENANIGAIRHLREEFPDYLIGYSDHTLPDAQMLVLTTAVLAGAAIIEKHFTLDKSIKGNDHFHSMDPGDLSKLRSNLNFIQKMWGLGKKSAIRSESIPRKFARRSLVAKKNIPKGAIITANLLTHKRPGTGISPQSLGLVIGLTARRNIKEDKIITWKDLKKNTK